MTIIQTLIFRSADGLPLSASTDVDENFTIKNCQKYMKLLSKRLKSLPDRCTLSLEGFSIHLTCKDGVTFLLLCDHLYPVVLAVCCLNEINHNFFSIYNTNDIFNAKRPYAFIEYETALQKIKSRYNNPRSLRTRVDLSEMSQELRLRPSYQITESDLYNLNGNGIDNTHRHRPTVIPSRRLVPLNWFGFLSISLNIFSAVLNLMRGMIIIGHGPFDDHDSGAYGYGSIFLILSVLYCCQVYLILFMTKWRHLLTIILLISHLYCTFCVLPLRNMLQMTFFLAVTFLSTSVILTRHETSKLSDYSV